jgi:hypothetical protein
LTAATTSLASAIWGMALGLTKEVTSILRIPAARRVFTRAIFFSVGMNVLML